LKQRRTLNLSGQSLFGKIWKENVMSSKGLEVIDHSVQLTHEWINELGDRLDWPDQKQVLQLLRTVLTAQLPILVRGMYYEGWRPAKTPDADRSKESFIARIEKHFTMDLNFSAEDDIACVFRFLNGKVSPGEISDVRNALPPKIRELWPEL
jgi:uncharacterized protein (DUF2267 family)